MTGPGRALRFYAVGAMVCAMALADSRTATRQTHLKNLERLLEQAAHHGQTGNGSTSVQHTNSSIKALEDIRAEVIAMLALQPQGHGHDQGQDHAAPGASTAVLSAAALDNAATVNTPDVIDRGKVKSTNATCTRLQILTCATYNSGEWKTWHDALSIETQARIAAARRTKQSAAQSAQPQYLPPLNLCLGKKWGGWGWKLQQLADWVTELNLKQDTLDAAARARACTIVVLYVDGKDVFVNRHVSHGEAVARWKKIGTDIVISTEMVCYTGDYCHDRDILKYYSHLVPGNVATPSTYCNSAVMGTTVALASVIPALIESYTAFRNGKKFNDQEAMTYLAAGKMPTLPYKVGTDVHQSIFGSMVYAKPYSNLPQTLNASNAVRPPHRAVTCFDFKRKAHAIAGCFGSDDVGPEHSGGAKQLYTVMENCDIGRREDLTQDMLGGLSGDNLLERVPLLWCVLHN